MANESSWSPHGGVVTAFARYVLGVPQDAPRRFDIGNASLSLFYRNDERGWMARFLGDVAHLEHRRDGAGDTAEDDLDRLEDRKLSDLVFDGGALAQSGVLFSGTAT